MGLAVQQEVGGGGGRACTVCVRNSQAHGIMDSPVLLGLDAQAQHGAAMMINGRYAVIITHHAAAYI